MRLQRTLNTTGWVQRISFICILIALVALVGWMAHIPGVEDILPSNVLFSLRGPLSIFLAGVLLFLVGELLQNRNAESNQVGVAIVTLALLTLTIPPLLGILLGIPGGIDWESDRPSIGTVIGFLGLALVGFLNILHPFTYQKITNGTGIVITFIGLVALVGHALGQPWMHYSTSSSSGMVIQVALLFVLFGIGFGMVKGESTRAYSY